MANRLNDTASTKGKSLKYEPYIVDRTAEFQETNLESLNSRLGNLSVLYTIKTT